MLINKFHSILLKHRLSSFTLILILVISLQFSLMSIPKEARGVEPITVSFVSVAIGGAIVGAFTYALQSKLPGEAFNQSDLIVSMISGATTGMAMLAMAYFTSAVLITVCAAYTLPGISDQFGVLLVNVFEDIAGKVKESGDVFSLEFRDSVNSLSNIIEQRITQTIQNLEIASGGTHIEVQNNLPIWANLGKTITTSGLTITTNGTDYSDTYTTRRMLYPGNSYIEARFSLSELVDQVCLTLVHLSSASQAATNGGYSPVDIYINGVLFQNNYDVAQVHGNHGWHEDNWQIGSYLHKGDNVIRIELEDAPWAETHYWFRYLSVRPGSLKVDLDLNEPNNSYQQSSPLGKIVGEHDAPNLNISSGDVDYYKFELVTTGTQDDSVQIYLQNNALSGKGIYDLDLAIGRLNNRGNWVPASGSWYNSASLTDTRTETISLEGYEPGEYYAVVFGASGYDLGEDNPDFIGTEASGYILLLHGPTPKVATPSISPNGGTYTGSTRVELICSTPSTTIRYTTNGTTPTSSSTRYTGAFTVSSSSTVIARGFKIGYTDSNIASASFIIAPEEISELSVKPNAQLIDVNSGTTTFNVDNIGIGTMPWTASVISGVNWLSITSGSSGTNSGTITAALSANTSDSSRTGTVRITASGAIGSPKDVTMIQSGVNTDTDDLPDDWELDCADGDPQPETVSIKLLSPGDGTTNGNSVDFKWEGLSGVTNYKFYLSEYPCFDENEAVNVASLYMDLGRPLAGFIPLGIGVISLIGFGRRRNRSFFPCLLLLILVSGALVISCGGDGDGGGTSDSPQPTPVITHSVSGLVPSTTYYWKVEANDGSGTPLTSAIRNFTTD